MVTTGCARCVTTGSLAKRCAEERKKTANAEPNCRSRCRMRWLSKISLAALLKDTAIGRTRFQKGYRAIRRIVHHGDAENREKRVKKQGCCHPERGRLPRA